MNDEVTQVVSVIREAAEAMRLAINRNSLPLDKTFWTREDCAHFLQYAPRTMERIEQTPGYPKARRPGGHPRWIAAEVINWAQDQ